MKPKMSERTLMHLELKKELQQQQQNYNYFEYCFRHSHSKPRFLTTVIKTIT